jgi:hypothetical protein
MKHFTVTCLAITSLCFISCGKNYTCVCTNPGGSENVFVTHSSKSKADEKCKKYYNEHYAQIPWNETDCRIK